VKILFVEQSEELQSKWIEPLRKKGWGVVRARSAEDASRMVDLHGDGLEAVVVGERFAPWAQKQELPVVVLVSSWADSDVIKHQNSETPAVAYLSFQKGTEELYSLFEAGATRHNLKSTGTDGVPVHTSFTSEELELEDYSDILSRPEPTSSGMMSFKLDSPNVVLGGADAKPEVEAFSFSEEDSAGNRTMILDATSLQMEVSGVKEIPDGETFGDLDLLKLDEEIVDAPLERREHIRAPDPVYSAPISQFSVNPTPTGSISDLETLRSYLALREQDVAVLSGQMRSSQERLQQLEMLLKVEKARGAELSHLVSKQEQKIKSYDQEKQVELEVLELQIADLDQQLKERTEKTRTIETKLRLTVEEVNKVKDRVRVDIRRIRVREKELEGNLEILKKDSSALLQARDEKILELKRKIDLLEFNMELIQEQFSKEKQSATDLKTKLKDASLVMKQASGLLGQ
jgi:hypothetical protein